MGKRKYRDSRSESKSTSSISQRIEPFVYALLGGVVVAGVQAKLAPTTAEKVMIKESITQKRYEACEQAINLLQKELASIDWLRGNVPEGYIPPEEPPSQLELNVGYTLLATYGKSGEVCDEFFRALDYEKNEAGLWVKKPVPERNSPKAIANFVIKLREEMDIAGTGIDPNSFGYIFRRPKK